MNHRCVLIEGVWGVGKTLLSSEICRRSDAVYIPEPDHTKIYPQPEDREAWYWEQFIHLREKAFLINKKSQSVVMERTALSVLAYLYALNDQVRLAYYLDKLSPKIYAKCDLVLLLPSGSHLQDLRKRRYELSSKITGIDVNPLFVLRYNQFLLDNYDLLNCRKTILVSHSDWLNQPAQIVERILTSTNEK